MTPPLEKNKKILEIHWTHLLSITFKWTSQNSSLPAEPVGNSASYWYLFVFVAVKPRPHLTLIGPVILQPVENDSDGRMVFEMNL